MVDGAVSVELRLSRCLCSVVSTCPAVNRWSAQRSGSTISNGKTYAAPAGLWSLQNHCELSFSQGRGSSAPMRAPTRHCALVTWALLHACVLPEVLGTADPGDPPNSAATVPSATTMDGAQVVADMAVAQDAGVQVNSTEAQQTAGGSGAANSAGASAGRAASTELCVPGSRECTSGTLVVCSADGAQQTSEICPNGCAASEAACSVACESNVATCTGGKVTACRSDGLGLEATDCKDGCDPQGLERRTG